MQNHDVFWYSNQGEYKHQRLDHTSETYCATHLACNNNRTRTTPLVSSYNQKTRQESCAIANTTARCTLYMSALKIFVTH